MRTPILTVSVLVLMMLTPPTRAGVYLPPHHGPYPMRPNFKFYQLQQGNRLALVMTKEKKKPTQKERENSSLLDEVWNDIEALEKKRAANSLTVEEGIRLGGHYLLVKNHANEALTVLKEVQDREPTNFMLLGNLATTYFVQGALDRAVATQDLMLKSWPKEVPRWTPARLSWQLRVETLFLKFLTDRFNESQREPLPGVRKPFRPEPLFPGVRFVDRNGKYTAGEIDPRMLGRLPDDAVAMVEQLILWLPEKDTQELQWLLAELFNAHGDIRGAYTIIEDLRFNKGISAAELDEHRRILKQAVDTLPPDKEEVEKPTETKPAPEEDPPSALPNWRTFAIGVGVGVLLGALLLLQGQQLFRSSRR